MPDGDFDAFLARLQVECSWLPPDLCRRYARAYGTRVRRLLAGADRLAALGEEVLPGLYAAEIRYLCAEEWAQSARDILWRRSKLGLHLPPGSEARLDNWLRAHASAGEPA